MDSRLGDYCLPKGAGSCKAIVDDVCSSVDTCKSGVCNSYDGTSGSCQEGCSDIVACPPGQQCLSEVLYCDDNYKNCDHSPAPDKTIVYVPFESGSGMCYDQSTTDCDELLTCSSGYCDKSGQCKDDIEFECTTDTECTGIGDSTLLCRAPKYCATDLDDCQDSKDDNHKIIQYNVVDGTIFMDGVCVETNINGSSCNSNLEGCEHYCSEDSICVTPCSDSTPCLTGNSSKCNSIEYCEGGTCDVTSTASGDEWIEYDDTANIGVCLVAKADGISCDVYYNGC